VKSKCPTVEQLDRFVERECTEGESSSIDAHVMECDRCRIWLNEACQEDVLLGDIRRVIKSADLDLGPRGISGVDQTDSRAATSPAQPDSLIPKTIAGYEILGFLGEGGMGVVYEARQSSPARTVALKVIRPGVTSPVAVQRFKHEGHLLGRLNHPGIAQIFEAGTTGQREGHQPFFAMELVEGQTLTKHAEEQELSLRERLALLLRVCDAVSHAHLNNVIHRDLKPANILVDAGGQPKVLDFGVARATDGDVQVTTLYTAVGQIIGTLAYMSPEQVAGRPEDIDIRSDVYSLGVIGFELLTQRLPHDLSGKIVPEAARIIREAEPVSLGSVNASLRGDVETILGKAIEKDMGRRYQSAAELAADLRRFLADEPIHARPPTTFYQLRKFSQRNKAMAISIAIAFLGLLAGTVGATWQAVRATRSGRLAAIARDLARDAEDDAKERQAVAEYNAYVASIAAAAAALREHDVLQARRCLESAPRRYRNWEWDYLRANLDKSLLTFVGHERWIACIAFSPDGTQLASGGKDRTVRIWDVRTGQIVRVLKGHARHVLAVSYSPNGDQLASASFGGMIRLWDTATGMPTATLQGPTEGVTSLAFSPNGRRLLFGARDMTVRSWCLDTDENATILAELPDMVWSVAISPDGLRLVAGVRNSTAVILDASSGEELATLLGHSAEVKAVAFSSDGEQIATASLDGAIRLWDAGSNEETANLTGHRSGVLGVQFSPDGGFIASASKDCTLRIWSTSTGRQVSKHHGHANWLRAVAFSPDGSYLATASADRTLKLWSASDGEPRHVVCRHENWVRSVAFSPDGHFLASGSFDHTINLCDPASRREIATLSGHTGRVHFIVFNHEGTQLASASEDAVVKLWDVRDAREIASLRGHAKAVFGVAFCPADRLLASASKDGTVILWDVASRAPIKKLSGHADWVTSVQFSPDGRHLLSASRDSTACVWDVATGSMTLRGHAGDIRDVSFIPDDTRLASASSDTTIRIWDIENGIDILILRGHTHWVHSVAFNPTGSCLASGAGSYEGLDCTVRLWAAGANNPWPVDHSAHLAR